MYVRRLQFLYFFRGVIHVVRPFGPFHIYSSLWHWHTAWADSQKTCIWHECIECLCQYCMSTEGAASTKLKQLCASEDFNVKLMTYLGTKLWLLKMLWYCVEVGTAEIMPIDEKSGLNVRKEGVLDPYRYPYRALSHFLFEGRDIPRNVSRGKERSWNEFPLVMFSWQFISPTFPWVRTYPEMS